ncbi:E3 ubiquitin-protein ligase RNF4 [Bicyclus anynana]|uniref:E3 ubiquitin-protein ligase RNF4 n=1 Tax=Bicyclus anynana TaxID=110368 RepID=A0ABM3LEL2_BICAN|nr:E3 ubiquitin-protein ligase RNF4 [Bicyclus anynana]
MNYIVDFIDLTSPVTPLRDEVINLDSDESFDASLLVRAPRKSRHMQIVISTNTRSNTNTKPNNNQKQQTNPEPSKITIEKTKNKFGDCPICWDELGKNPLASTVCGHVFCFKCLKQALLRLKQCPTCRRALRDERYFHPLYIPTV